MKENQTVEQIAQSRCAQCGAQLTSTDGADQLCINCLLRCVMDQDDVDPDKTSRRSDRELIAHNDGVPIEFGDYEFLEEIGRGSQGVVYRARQKSLNRIVALKVIALGHWATEPHVKRFRREAEAAARLNHPGIVPIYEVGERDGACYFSMGLIEGGQLDAMLESASRTDSSCGEREPMPIRSAVELIVKLARTVQYAHEHNILHRDIKPGNILLDAKGEPHLTDFGLARLVETESTVTGTLEVLGTPSYMAPEQAAGETTRVSKATDVYGLGAVLYQLLTRQPPFAGGTTYDTIKLLLETEPKQPRQLNPKVDRELSTICLKCLEKKPQRRYSSALALAEDLEHWLKHEPIQARRTGLFVRGKKWLQRKPAIAGVIILSLALALAIGWNIWKTEFVHHPVAKGIAVLPFENLSGNPDNAYFADGIQEEILTRLAKIADLKVISRTSTQRYHSKLGNLPEIAKQLGVANILEGSVQKAADQVRVNVQLINAQTDSHLWADTYERKLTDIFGVESEIAKRIAESLQAKLSGHEQQALAVKPTNNPEAYEAYLRGLAFQARGYSEDDLRKAIGFFEQAVQRDSNFAFAWARLSRAHTWKYFYNDGTALRRDTATKALENAQNLEPSSPETLLALGYYQYWVLHDYGAAKTTFQRVSKIEPSNSEVPHGLAFITRREGHWNESIAYFEQALALDPRNVELLSDTALNYAMLRQFPTALKLYDRALDIVPNDPDIMASEAGIFQGQGNLPEAARLLSGINEQPANEDTLAIKTTQLRLERNYGEVIRLLQVRLAQFHFLSEVDKGHEQAMLPFLQRLSGDSAGASVTAREAREALETSLKNRTDDELWASLALANAVIGEKGSALEEAERAMMLWPSSKDPVNGPTREENLALVQTVVGDNDRAISTLARLLQTPYASWLYGTPITPALLRLDPIWDPLRGDPAFQKLCEEKQPVVSK